MLLFVQALGCVAAHTDRHNTCIYCAVNTCARTQIPLFHLSGKIIAKLGVKTCIALAQAAYVLRFLNYTVLTDPVWVLPSEVLHGFTFAIMYCAMYQHCFVKSRSARCHTAAIASIAALQQRQFYYN
eukprot:17611-Heterococcus_DN1.PRE.2